MRCVVEKLFIDVGQHIGIDSSNLHVVTIDDPLVVGIVARNGTHAPVERDSLLRLVESAIQVLGSDGGSINCYFTAVNVAVINVVVTGEIVLHFVCAYVLSRMSRR